MQHGIAASSLKAIERPAFLQKHRLMGH